MQLIDEAIFTSPPHQNWGGAALIDSKGTLVGVGSLFVRNAAEGDARLPGNMFVPINLVKPILADMLATGRGGGPGKPWLGVFSQQMLGLVVVTFVSPDGPAAKAGLRRGDVIMGVGGEGVTTQEDFYRALWAQGDAGVKVDLKILREGEVLDFPVQSGDRYEFLRDNGS